MANTNTCEICSEILDCPCKDEQNLRQKNRTCAQNAYCNKYPRSKIDFNELIIHICSRKCLEEKEEIENKKWISMGYKVVRYHGYTNVYDPTMSTEQEALEELREALVAEIIHTCTQKK
jgi:hypothetical protein